MQAGQPTVRGRRVLLLPEVMRGIGRIHLRARQDEHDGRLWWTECGIRYMWQGNAPESIFRALPACGDCERSGV